jgi:hypothetical protein
MTKYIDNYLSRVKYPSVIVCREKHGTPIYDATSEEKLLKSCLSILKHRNDSGWYFKPDKPRPPKDLLSDEEIAKLPEVYRTAQIKMKNVYSSDLLYYERDLKIYEGIEAALKEKDGKKALAVLLNRSDYEYEGFSIKKLYS